MGDLTKKYSQTANGGRDLFSTPDTAIKGAEIMQGQVGSIFEGIRNTVTGNEFYSNLSEKDRKKLENERVGSRGLANIENTALDNKIDETYLKATEQSKGEKLLNTLLQIGVNEMILGTVKSVGDIYDAITHIGNPDDFSSDYTRYFEELQDKFREEHPINQRYEDAGIHFNDFGWWMNGLVSAGSTVSLMIPAAGITKGLGLIAKASKINKLVPLAVKTTNTLSKGKLASEVALTTAKINTGIESFSQALMSRIAENYQEGREVYKLVHDDVKERLKQISPEQKTQMMLDNPELAGMTDEEIASYLATQAGNHTYWTDFAMLAFDVAQFHGLNKIWKGKGNVPLTDDVIRAQRASLRQLETDASDIVYKTSLKDRWLTKEGWISRGENIKYKFKKEPLNLLKGLQLSEGIEEGYQGIMSKEGQRRAELYFNPETPQSSLLDYLQDPEIHEQAFFGVLGGVAFQGVGKVGKQLKTDITASYLKHRGKIKDDEYQRMIEGLGNIRISNIKNRTSIIEKAKANSELLDQGKDYLNPIFDENGKITDYEAIEDVRVLETRRYQNFKQAVQDLVIQAESSGNLDLVKEYINNPKFKEYLQREGITREQIDDEELGKIINETSKEFATAREDILYNLQEATSPYLVDLAATNLTHYRIFQHDLREHINVVNSNLANKNKIDNNFEDDDNEEYKKQLKKTVRAYIKQLQSFLSEQENLFKSKDNVYSIDAFNADKNTINKQIAALLDFYSSIDQDFLSLEDVKPLLDKNGILKTTENILENVKTQYKQFIEGIKEEPNSDIDLEVQDLFKTKARLQIEEILNGAKLPEYKKYYYKKSEVQNAYQQFFDNTVFNFSDVAKAKFINATQTITDWISKQEDLDKALETLKNPNLRTRKLDKAYKLIKFGSQNNRIFDSILTKFILDERNKRNETKKTNDNITIDGKEATESQKRKIDKNEEKENISESTKSEEQKQPQTNKRKTIQEQIAESVNSPSTGKTQVKEEEPISPVKEDYDNLNNPEDSNQYEEPEAKPDNFDQELYDVLNEGPQFDAQTFITPRQAESEISKIISELAGEDYGRWQKVYTNGEGSNEYNEFLDLVLDRIKGWKNETSLSYEDLSKLGLKSYLSDLLTRRNREDALSKDIYKNRKSFDKFVRDIFEIAKGLKYDEQNAIFIPIDEIERTNAAKRFVENYINEQNISKVNGKYTIDINDVFAYLYDLCEETDFSYEELLDFYDKFKDCVNLLKNEKEFIFINKGILGKRRDIFLNHLYEQKSEVKINDAYMHTARSNFVVETELENLLSKHIDEEIEFVSDRGSISIRLKNGQEISYLAKVRATETNTEFSTIGLFVGIDKNGKYYHTYDGIINSALGSNTFLYDYLKSLFIAFNDKTNRYEINQKAAYADFVRDSKNIIKLLQLDEVKEYLQTSLYDEVEDEGFNYYDAIYDANGNIKKEILDVLNKFSKYELSQITPGFGSAFNNIVNIMFYELNNFRKDSPSLMDNKSVMMDSYQEYKKAAFDNYSMTYDIQKRLEKGEKVTGYLRGDNTLKIQAEEEKELIEVAKDYERYPNKYKLVYVDGSTIISEDNKEYTNKIGFGIGTIGIRIGETSKRGKDNDGLPQMALFNVPNKVINSEEGEKLADATKQYIIKAINDYYDVIRDKKSLASDKNAAFETLKKTFSDLFGNKEQNIFNRFFVTDVRGNSFRLSYRKGKDDFVDVAYFYRYSNIKYEKQSDEEGVYRDRKTNEILTDEELNGRLNGNITFIDETKEEDDKERRLSINNSKGKKEQVLIDKFITRLTNEMTYNGTKFAAKYADRKDVPGRFLKKENGKIVIQIGEGENGYRKEYNSFAQFAIENNAFRTTSAGRKVKLNPKEKIKSIYIEYSDKETPITKEQFEKDKNKGKNNKKEINKLIRDTKNEGKEVEIEEFLRITGAHPDKVRETVLFDKELKAISTNKLGILPDKIIIIRKDVDAKGIEKNRFAFHRNEDKSVYITLKGLKEIEKRPDFGLTLPMHENVHKIIDETSYFEGKDGERRINGLIDTFETYYQVAKDKQGDIGNFARSFYDKYYKNAKTKQQRNLLAQEWLAEVMTNIGLMRELNTIPSGETIIINNEEKPQTLLGKLFRFIAELFYNIRHINDNSLLAEIYDIVDKNYTQQISTNIQNGTQLTLFDENGNPVVINENEPETKEEKEIKNSVEETSDEDENDEDEDIDDYEELERRRRRKIDFNEFDEDASFLPIDANGLDEQGILNAFEENAANNPKDIQTASDMNAYLQRYNPLDRRIVAQGIAKNEFKYNCR